MGMGRRIVDFSLPIGDDFIENLIAQLTIKIDKYGSESQEVEDFIAQNKEVIFVDPKTNYMHTFAELAYGLKFIIGGISQDVEDDQDPANWWK